MSMRYYPVYSQGAIIYSEDYDPVKVIITLSEELVGGLSPEIQSVLKSNVYDQEVAQEICGLLDVTFDPNATDYSFISDNFTEDLSYWIDDGYGKIENGIVESFYFTDLEAEFRYASEDIENERLESCLILSLHSPLIWGIAEFDGPKTKQEVIDCIREAVKHLLRDDINWERRLGDLVGTTFG